MANKSYSAEQKAAALAKVAEIGVTKAAKELSISPATLNAWKKAAATKEDSSTATEAVADTSATKADEAAPAPKKRGRKPGVKKVVEETKTAVKKANARVSKNAKKLTEKATEVKKAATAKKADVAKNVDTAKKTAEKATLLTLAKQEKLIADNATLKAENASLKAEIAKLKKAIAGLTK